MKLRHAIVSIPTEGVWLDGRLSHAPDVRALAILLLASAVSRDNPPESSIAGELQKAGFATLLMDLVTHQEDERDPDARFNVPQMTRRLLGVMDWIGHQPALQGLPVGLIGSATSSAVAVRAAWKAPDRFGAIVCRGGRPDLAGAAPLRALRTPVRFVVGTTDPDRDIAAQAFALIEAERDWQDMDTDADLVPGPDGGDERQLDARIGITDFSSHVITWLTQTLPRPETPEIQGVAVDATGADQAESMADRSPVNPQG